MRTAIVALACLCTAAPACAEDDGEEFLRLLRNPASRELAQRYIDNAANKWEGRVICTPEDGREQARFVAVRDWFEAHPEEMWRPQRYLIMQGLQKSFPCAPKS
jgi:hypothetical protein